MSRANLLLTPDTEHQELLWKSPHYTSPCVKGNSSDCWLIFKNLSFSKPSGNVHQLIKERSTLTHESFSCQRAFCSSCRFCDIWSLWKRKAGYWLQCGLVRASKQGFYKSKQLVGSRECQKGEDEKQFSNTGSILGQMGFAEAREAFSVIEEKIVGDKWG